MLLLFIVGGIILVFGATAFIGAPYVPSRRRDLKGLFDELYQLSSSDVLVDIGSGDGVVLRMSASHGASAVGYEINPFLVLISKLISRKYGSRITVRLADFWRVPLPDETTIVYTFGDSRDIARMARRVQAEATRLHKTIHFISYGFELKKIELVNRNATHFLYRFEPLQA